MCLKPFPFYIIMNLYIIQVHFLFHVICIIYHAYCMTKRCNYLYSASKMYICYPYYLIFRYIFI